MILSCDPGIKGALALRDRGAVLASWTMPVYEKEAGARGAQRKFIDEGELLEIIQGAHAMGADLFAIEEVSGLPNQSAAGAFVFGRGYGAAIMAARSCGFRLETVPAARWKQRLRVPADKPAATVRACELMPADKHHWAVRRGLDKEKANGIAEAAMIGLYAERHL